MKVIVALSGGVDSAAAAILLKRKGHEVIGVHMKNWDVEINEGIFTNESACSGTKDLELVRELCEALDIPLYLYNFVPEYWEYVFDPYIESLEKNLNKNPDISCNSLIKFGVLLDQISKDFGDSVVLATGHWAKVVLKNEKYYLAVCKNKCKDQTYFLSSLNAKQLSRVIFPLFDLVSKDQVRDILKSLNLSFWDKKDSMGICFVGKRNYQSFVSKYIEEKPGNFVDISNGKVLGHHKGTHLYVLYQRSGLYLKGYEDKYYVCGKNISKNIVYLCTKSLIPKYLYKDVSLCIDVHWIQDIPLAGEEIFFKTRHGSPFFRAKILDLSLGKIRLHHDLMFVTSPGQFLVFYDLSQSICLGNGVYWIENT